MELVALWDNIFSKSYSTSISIVFVLDTIMCPPKAIALYNNSKLLPYAAVYTR
jgi:hypothetical protein